MSSAFKQSKTNAICLPVGKHMLRRVGLPDGDCTSPSSADMLPGLPVNLVQYCTVPRSLLPTSAPGNNFMNIERYNKVHHKVCIFLHSCLHTCLFFVYFSHCCQRVIFLAGGPYTNPDNGWSDRLRSVVLNRFRTLWGSSENV